MLQGSTRAPANSQQQHKSAGDLWSQPPQSSRLRVTSRTGSSTDRLPEAVLLPPPGLQPVLAPTAVPAAAPALLPGRLVLSHRPEAAWTSAITPTPDIDTDLSPTPAPAPVIVLVPIQENQHRASVRLQEAAAPGPASEVEPAAVMALGPAPEPGPAWLPEASVGLGEGTPAATPQLGQALAPV